MIDIDELLQPAVDAFKDRAQSAIDAATEKMTNVLRVRYATESAMNPDGCPLPRLQFRWEEIEDGSYVCHYEFVFPLDRNDIRSTDFNGSSFAVIELGRTKTSGSRNFLEGLAHEAPYRDGVHAQWDTPHFGNPPTYVIAPDGRFAERAQRPR